MIGGDRCNQSNLFVHSFQSLLILLALTLPSIASAKPAEVSIGLKYKTNLMERGAVFYKNWQVLPVLYFGLFKNKLQVAPSKIEYNDFLVGNTIRGRTGLQLFTDDFLISTGAGRTVRNSRTTTVEWVNTLELFLPNYVGNLVTLQFWAAKALDQHKGVYAKFDFAVSIIKFLKDKARDRALALVEPQIFASIGFGDSRHNHYLYGTNVPNESALTDFEVGLRIVSPSKFDRYFPAFELSYFSVLDKDLKNGNLLVNDTSGYRAELTFAINIY